MNDDGTPIESTAAGQPEGASVAEPTTQDVQNMYDELGIKASAPTGKSVGRPKSAEVRDKDDDSKDGKNSKPGEKGADGGSGKPKDAPASNKDGGSGDDSDAKGKKVGEDSGQVSGKSEKAGEGVRDDESRADKDSEPDGEGGSDEGDDGTGQNADKPGDQKEEGQGDEGKRPGKSNPEVEKRFQKLTGEVKERDQVIAKLQQEIADRDAAANKAKIDSEDPVYTVEDFRKVRDEDGNIIDLDANQAELAYRRWKDGYDQRKVEREAKFNHDTAIAKAQQDANEKLMKSSVDAYDTLMDIYENTPELDSKSDKFDQEFSNLVMPLIQDAVIYLEGTEPGNAEGKKSVIVGFKMNPKTILTAMNTIKQSKRSLPLNGIKDTVESSSNVSVGHGRSSDPTVKAANELMKELGIDKRF